MKPSKVSLVLSLVFLTTGCLGGVLASPDISADEAKARAEADHDELTRRYIDHYDSYGVYQPSSEVINVTHSGYYIHVTQEYYYTNGELETDSVNEATYFVNETTTRRVSQS
ncbi:hypothetical protein [Haloferax sp. DFSO60]|uniref:hypothetical protein n=1 Tax=Haloferax sp. DFSO60 TaxID=3388652 RepID=UPI00397D2D63